MMLKTLNTTCWNFEITSPVLWSGLYCYRSLFLMPLGGVEDLFVLSAMPFVLCHFKFCVIFSDLYIATCPVDYDSV